MRKIFFIALFAVVSFSMHAQDYQKAVGLRLGLPLGLSYKTFMSPKNALEGIVDLDIFDKGLTKLTVSGFYVWQWQISQVKGLSWYAGPGASAGMFLYKGGSDFNVSINGMIGVEYKIPNIPLVVAADYAPRFYLLNSAGYYTGTALTARYIF